MAKLSQKFVSLSAAMAFLACMLPAAAVGVQADEADTTPICTTADEWTALFDRRSQTETWLGGDGIYSVALNGNDAYGSATGDTKTFFIFSDSLMGTSDAEGNVTWAPGQPSQTSAVLTGNEADPDNIRFVWGTGGNMQFAVDGRQDLFGEHKWMLDCFVVGDSVYILGFPEQDWKPRQIDMIEIPIVDGEPDYANYEETESIPQLWYRDDSDTYLYAYGIGVMANTESAGAPNPDGYIYFYGYRDAMKEFSRKDLIVARLQESDFPDFSNMTYWDGESWSTNIEDSEPILRSVSCEMSVTPITTGPCEGKYIAIYTENTESANQMYAIGDSPAGPFEKPVKFYTAPEHGQDNGGMYTYNAKAHPHLSSDGKLLVSYNCNNRHTFGRQKTTEYHPRFLWLDLNAITPAEENLSLADDATVTASSEKNGSPAELAIDGDVSSYWESDDTIGTNDEKVNQWISVSWEEAKSVDRLVLLWGGGKPVVDDPNGYKLVEYTEDGVTWHPLDVTVTRTDNPDDTANGLPKTDTLTWEGGAVTAKAVRVTFAAYSFSPYQLYEFEVYAPEESENPGGGDENPGGGDENPGGGDENPGGGDENPGGGDENPGGGDENPGGGDENPGGGNETPDTGIDVFTVWAVVLAAASVAVAIVTRKVRVK